MPYNVQIQIQPDHVHAELSGERVPGKELENAIHVLVQLAKLCEENGLSKILVSIDLIGDFPVLSAFKLAEAPQDFGWDKTLRIAAVDKNEKSREMMQLIASIAANRGFSVQVFHDESAAKAWLFDK